MIPEMLGTDLVREAAQISPQTVSLLMTGSVISSAEVPAGVLLLRKPIPTHDLLAAAQAALERSVRLQEKLASECERSAELQGQSQRLIAETRAAIDEAAKSLRESREARERIPKHPSSDDS
jgi:hypothetical protein